MKGELCATLTCLVVGFCVSGCGGAASVNVGKVRGKVTLEGQPLGDALVTFTPVQEGGSSALGKTDVDGSYRLSYANGIEGAEIGENRVSISTYDQGNPDGDPPRPKVLEKIPLKYNIRTELVREVKSGENSIDFDLQTDGPVIADPATIPDRPSSSCAD
jgi:hypothetical protein